MMYWYLRENPSAKPTVDAVEASSCILFDVSRFDTAQGEDRQHNWIEGADWWYANQKSQKRFDCSNVGANGQYVLQL